MVKVSRYIITRWSVVLAGFLLALMGGLAYAWGVFVIPMKERFGWTKAEATLPFTVFMIIFALVMVPAGKLQDKIGPKKVSFSGAILFFVAYGLASLVEYFPHLLWLVITYGIIGGTACGLTYACVAPPVRKWFPDKPGVAVSLSIMGFGIAALVFAPLKAGYLIPYHGIDGTFLLIAFITSLVCILASFLIKNPPEGWVPPGFDPEKVKKKTIVVREEFTSIEIIKTSLFWIIWSIFTLVIAGGFVALGFIPAYGEKIIGLTPIKAAFAISVFAGANGFGRPLAGLLADRFGIVSIMIFTYIIQGITFLFFTTFAVTMPTLYIAAAFLGWGYAVTLALFPTLTSICFGIKNLGSNYGIVFTAFGVGATSPAIGSWLFEITKSYTPVFIFTGILTIIGFILTIILKMKYKLP